MTKMITPSKTVQIERGLSSALTVESETLQNINDYFVHFMDEFKIYFFHEQMKTDLKYTKDVIVSIESAAPLYNNTGRAGIAATHSDMVRFESKNSHGFSVVISTLQRYCEDAASLINYRIAKARETLQNERLREAQELLGQIIPLVPPPVRPEAGSRPLTVDSIVLQPVEESKRRMTGLIDQSTTRVNSLAPESDVGTQGFTPFGDVGRQGTGMRRQDNLRVGSLAKNVT
jgi:hypothetical protein